MQLNINNILIRIKNINNNNFIVFSKNSFYIYNNFTYYEEIKIDLNFNSRNIFFINPIIIHFSTTLDTKQTISLYDLANKKLDKIQFKKTKAMGFIHNVYKIDKDKALISFSNFGIIINIKAKEIISKNTNFRGISSIFKIENYILIGNGNTISQINLKTGELFNCFSIRESDSEKEIRLLSFIDDKNNHFSCLKNSALY